MAKDQPAALATFVATARNDGKKRENIGLHATAETKAIAMDVDQKRMLRPRY